jgi:hypothetical protein
MLNSPIGALSEGQIAFMTNLGALKAVAQEQSATSKRQQKHIDRWVGIAETPVHKAS